jgi:hypothetical protein
MPSALGNPPKNSASPPHPKKTTSRFDFNADRDGDAYAVLLLVGLAIMDAANQDMDLLRTVGHECLNAALTYARRGLTVLPLCNARHTGVGREHGQECDSPGKAPVIRGWQKIAAFTEDQITEFWASPRWCLSNVGIRLGNGIMRIDVDGEQAAAKLAELSKNDLPVTWEFTRDGSPQRLYATPKNETWPTHSIKFNGDHQELKFQSVGSQSVVPPSLHAEGQRYQWLPGRSPDEIPLAPAPDWLARYMREQATAKKKTRRRAKTGKHTRLTPKLRARVLTYLNACPAAVSGEHGHDTCFATVRAVVWGFNLDVDTAYDLLAEHYNPRCLPPWSEQELRHKIKEADEVAFDKPRGYLLDLPYTYGGKPSDNGQADDCGEAENAQAPPDDGKGKGNGHEGGQGSEGGLVTLRLDGIPPKPVTWLVPNYLPLGKLILFAGDGGQGKSALTLGLAADLTRGRPCFGLDYPAPAPCNVLIASCEDGVADTIVPRLIAAGADRSRIEKIEGVRGPDGSLLPFNLSYYLEIKKKLESDPTIRLVIIDPAGAFIGGAILGGKRIDDHKESELRALLSPLAETAEARGVTFPLIKHFSKNENVKAVHKIAGSVGYVNTVRAAFVILPDADDPERKLLLPIKVNSLKPRGLAYRTVSLDPAAAIAKLKNECPDLNDADAAELAKQLFTVQWLGTVEHSADQVLHDLAAKNRDPNKVDRACEWLKEFLADFAYPSAEVIAAAKAEGFTYHNLRAAREKNNEIVTSQTKGLTWLGCWWWGLGKTATWTLRPTQEKDESRQE